MPTPIPTPAYAHSDAYTGSYSHSSLPLPEAAKAVSLGFASLTAPVKPSSSQQAWTLWVEGSGFRCFKGLRV